MEGGLAMSQSRTSSLSRDQQTLEPGGRKAGTPATLTHCSQFGPVAQSEPRHSSAFGDLGAVDWDYFSSDVDPSAVHGTYALNGEVSQEDSLGVNVETPGDDMENYFRSNLHLLEHLRVQEGPSGTETSVRRNNIQVISHSFGQVTGQGDIDLDVGHSNTGQGEGQSDKPIMPKSSFATVNGGETSMQSLGSERHSCAIDGGEEELERNSNVANIPVNTVNSEDTKCKSNSSKGGQIFKGRKNTSVTQTVVRPSTDGSDNDNMNTDLTTTHMFTHIGHGEIPTSDENNHRSVLTSQETASRSHKTGHPSDHDFHGSWSDKESNLRSRGSGTLYATLNGPTDHGSYTKREQVTGTTGASVSPRDAHGCDRCGIQGVQVTHGNAQCHVCNANGLDPPDKQATSVSSTRTSVHCSNGGDSGGSAGEPSNTSSTAQNLENDVLDFIDTDISSQVCNGLVNSASYRTAYSLSVDQSGLNDDSSSDEGFPQQPLNLPLSFRNGDIGLGDDDAASCSSEDEGLPRTRHQHGELMVGGAGATVPSDSQQLSCNIVNSGSSSSGTSASARPRAFPCPAGCVHSCMCNSPMPKIPSSIANKRKNNFYKEQHQNNLNDAHEAQASSNSESYQSSPFYSPDTDFLDFDLEWTMSGSDGGHGEVDDLGGGHCSRVRGNIDFVSREHDIQDVLQLDPAVSFNNLDFRFEEFSSSHSFEQSNVSRQTSTSNFDNDENSFQFEIPQDLEESEQTCRKERDGDSDEEQLAAPAGWAEQTARQLHNVNFDQGDLGGDEIQLLGFLERQELLHPLPDTDDEEEEEEDLYVGASDNIDDEGIGGNLGHSQQSEQQKQQQNHMIQEKQQDPKVKKTMIWKEYEALSLQVKQIGTSACGPTAVINVLQALKVEMDQEMVSSRIRARLRAETAPVADYLLSRSVAGTTAEDLIAGIEQVTEGRVKGRFFQFHPHQDIKLLHWLSAWICKGAVPLATLNLQCGTPPGGQSLIPDAWHHQMVYGVGPKGIYLTNPLELVPEETVLAQLCCESLLLIRREDIVKRWSVDCDLRPLLTQADPRWRTLNVLGQVINVIREEFTPHVPPSRPQLTSHVTIPAVYKPGITLFVLRSDSQALQELLLATDLP
ncbi:uncharacterized protein LOC106164260 [Lingula anatina]|uniref:Uncharacterized protein LOC106164260 n=1 Tax=Lingula anatina TaxID=7574 RepID=A0A1S3IJ95_LINAN|nr:uncharacterized protein LOC106164260 [Lingula anatina]|eukprot:XP_013397569.1 uncharacterized protein LOC106164260 [Lingula anatina]